MPGSPSRYSLGPSLRRGHEVGERGQSNEMGTSVLIMQPILRFLQLLCENHNRDLQVRGCPSPAARPARGPPPLPSAHCSAAGTGRAPRGRPLPPCESCATPTVPCPVELPALPEQQDQL